MINHILAREGDIELLATGISTRKHNKRLVLHVGKFSR